MNLAPYLRQRYFDLNGVPLAGGQLFSYAAGTTTPQVTYSNSTGTTNTNPVVLDSQGYADVWLDPTLSYKFVLEDVNNNVLWTVDNVSYPFGVAVWNSNTVYSQGNIVQDTSGAGLFYVSLNNNNQGNALTNVSQWRMLGGNIRTVSTSSTLLVTDELVRSNSTSTALTHTLPACSTTPIGKRITIKDVGTGGNTTTIKGAGTDNLDGVNSYGTTLSQYDVLVVENTGTTWDVIRPVLGVGAVTQSKLAARATGATVGAGGVAISASASPSTESTAFSDMTGLSVTITTTGRPVYVGLIPDGSGSTATLELNVISASTGAVGAGYWNILRGASVIASHGLVVSCVSSAQNEIDVPVSSLSCIDFPPAGTYTYKIQAKVNQSSPVTNTQVSYTKMIAYEI